jgi:DNA uptake protein ComE-like DNA-binding protein
MLNYITKYFTLNRSERNAVIALLTLVLVLIAVKYYVAYQYKTNTLPVVVVDLDSAAARLALEESMLPEGDSHNGSFIGKKHRRDSLFYFDPNLISAMQAEQLGFEPRCAQMLINYRDKGGKFHRPSDLSKLYCMDKELFSKLEPYIVIGSSPEKEETKTTIYKKEEPAQITLEINSADSSDWDRLRGIGFGYARRIIKYRSLLGGFTSVEQIKEVYNFPDSLYQSIKGNLTVNSTGIKKLKVNSAEFKEMVHHPYIKYEGTKCIFALKRNKKISQEDLVGSSCFTREHLQKLLPYLDFE